MKTFKSPLPFLGRSLTILSLIFLFLKLGQHFNDFPRLTLNVAGTATVGLAILFSTATVAIHACLWAVILRGGGVFLNLKEAYLILGKSQIGKYLPGNVFQYLGRIALGQRAGLPTEAVVLTIGVETLLLAGAAASVAAAGLLFDQQALIWLVGKLGEHEYKTTLFAIVASIILLAASVILFPRTRAWIYYRSGYLRMDGILKSVFLCFVVFIGYGALISLLLRALWGVETEIGWHQFTWGFALAWVLGFITPGAPGGLGVREVVLVGLYHPSLGEPLVIGLTLLLRVITILGDLLAFGLAVWLGRREGKEG